MADRKQKLLKLMAEVEQAALNLDPFNQQGAVSHPAYGYEVGNDEASKFRLHAALRNLRYALEDNE